MTTCLKAGVGNNERDGNNFIFSLFDPRGRIPGRSWIVKAIEYLDCRLRMIIRKKRS